MGGVAGSRNPEFGSARRFVTGFGDEFGDAGRPSSVRITQVPHRKLESVFEHFLAGEDLLARLGFGAVCEIPVRDGVGADLVTGREPVANFCFVHELFGRLTVFYVPIVSSADQSGDNELNGCHAVLCERFHSVPHNIPATIIERQGGGISGRGVPRFGKRDTAETVLFEQAKLAIELRAGNV
jgi:hypothetical protein